MPLLPIRGTSQNSFHRLDKNCAKSAEFEKIDIIELKTAQSSTPADGTPTLGGLRLGKSNERSEDSSPGDDLMDFHS